MGIGLDTIVILEFFMLEIMELSTVILSFREVLYSDYHRSTIKTSDKLGTGTIAWELNMDGVFVFSTAGMEIDVNKGSQY